MRGWRTIQVDQLPDPKTVKPWSIYQLPDKSFWYPDNMEGEGEATKWLTSEEHVQQWKDQREQGKQTCLKLFQINEQVDMTKWNEFASKEKCDFKSKEKYQTLSGKCFVRRIEEDDKCATDVRIFVEDELGHEVAVDTMWVEKL
jgi:hypothetical protein